MQSLEKSIKENEVALELENHMSDAISDLDLESLVDLAKIVLGLDHPTITKAKNILSSDYS